MTEKQGRGRPQWVPDHELVQPGEASDPEVARAHGVHRETVRRYRARHGIPAWERP